MESGLATTGPMGRPDWLLMVLAGTIAAILLFTNLGDKYLWQDEAATAVMGERMMKYGKPLAYDGKNLITMDNFAEEDKDTVSLRTGDAGAALQYFVARRDFKADSAWTGQPWGQFLVAGISLSMFGHSTVAARAPFAAAAMITIVLLYWFIRGQLHDRLMAAIAVGLVLSNTYWVLHSRQCRYYALTSLMLLLTLMAYTRWQREGRLGGLLFVIMAWCWFQVDFGTFWPVVGVLLILAAWRAWPQWTGPAAVALALAAAVSPWIWYYELFERLKTPAATWSVKFLGNLFHMNQFVIPLLVLIAAGLMLTCRWRKVPDLQRQLLLACLLILPISLVWVTSVAPWHFHRYIVPLTLLAAMIMAWLFVEAGREAVRRYRISIPPSLLAVTLGAVVAVCPLPSNLVSWSIPKDGITLHPLGTLMRPELAVLWDEVFGHRIDPNRSVIEMIKSMARPEDAILVNYEDIPFMFYTDNHIRGGIPCFRVEDRTVPPRFLVIRESVPFLHWPVFIREIKRYTWRSIPVRAPIVPFGNNPDPDSHPAWMSPNLRDMIVAERVDNAS
jgi:hypothetical protein